LAGETAAVPSPTNLDTRGRCDGLRGRPA